MRKRKRVNFAHLKVYFVALCCLPLFSCIKENSDKINNQKKYLTLSISLPTSQAVRSVDVSERETKVEVIDVLLFDEQDEFVEKIEASQVMDVVGQDHRKKFEITLPYGTYDLIILGNCRNAIDAAGLPEGASRTTVIESLKYAMDAWLTDELSNPVYVSFPIWGEVKGVIVDASLDLTGTLVPMLRAVTRIDVKLSDALYNAEAYHRLRSVYLYNRYTQAQLIPDDGKVTNMTVNPDNFDLTVPSIPKNPGAQPVRGPLFYEVTEQAGESQPFKQLEATIYTFEALAGSISGWEKNTCLVVGIGLESDQGNWANSFPNPNPVTRALTDSTWYYRIDFMDQNNYLPLLRNHNYEVEIQSLNELGFPDPEMAFRSQSYGVEYKVLPWEFGGYDVEGGIYRLDISSTYISLTNWSWGDIWITTTHPEGWSAYVSIDPIDPFAGNGDWLNIYPYDNPSPTQKLLNQPADETIYFGIDGGSPANDQDCYRYIHIISGNLTNVITVYREYRTGA